jgi:hypothetical protein
VKKITRYQIKEALAITMERMWGLLIAKDDELSQRSTLKSERTLKVNS